MTAHYTMKSGQVRNIYAFNQIHFTIEHLNPGTYSLNCIQRTDNKILELKMMIHVNGI